MRHLLGIMLMIAGILPTATAAVDPTYQPSLERLANIMGTLYFLAPLCGIEAPDWRDEVAELIDLDAPDDDRRQRLYGTFNEGYGAYARLHRGCGEPARLALIRLLSDADDTARDVRAQFVPQ